jgi:anti-sigma B factor antagonist
MFDIRVDGTGRVVLSGRLYASEVDRARAVLAKVTRSTVLDLSELEYISSLGLGILLEAQKRLSESGQGLVMTNLSPHISELFTLAGFDAVFEIR